MSLSFLASVYNAFLKKYKTAQRPQRDLHCELLSVTQRATHWHLRLSIYLTLFCPYALGGNGGLDLTL